MPPKRARAARAVPAVAAATTPPPAPRKGRKKKADTIQPVEAEGATASSNADLSAQMATIISLLKAKCTPPEKPVDPQPSARPALHDSIQVPTPAELTAAPQARGAFAEAAMVPDSRIVGTAGSINLTEYLFRRAQRKICEGSIDMPTAGEFVYAFIGYVLESNVIPPRIENQ